MPELRKTGIARVDTDVIPAKAGIQKKKYKYSKFLKLKAEVISLYAGFPPMREGVVASINFTSASRGLTTGSS